MIKKCLSFISVFFLFTCFLCAAFVSQETDTITCSVNIGPLEALIVSHTGLTTINGIGNDINVKLQVVSKYEIPSVDIKYKYENDSTVNIKTASIEYDASGIYSVTISMPAATLTKAGTLYYAVKATANNETAYWPAAVDASDYVNVSTMTFQGVEVSLSKTVTINSSTGGSILFASGSNNIENLRIIIPPNAFTSPSIDFTATQKLVNDVSEIEDKNTAVSAYEVTPNTEFLKPVTIRIAYPDVDGDGKINIAGNLFDEKEFRAFYWDGASWDILGSVVDQNNNSITFQTKHFSLFSLLHVNIDKDFYRPKGRILTPNGDGYNDKIIFSNLEGYLPVIKIFDVNGRLVKEIADPPYEWDGKDKSGRILESGVYIYQFRASVDNKDQVVSGTLALAK